EKKSIMQGLDGILNLLKQKYGNSIGEMNKKRREYVKLYAENYHSLKESISNFLEFLLSKKNKLNGINSKLKNIITLLYFDQKL
ncbi:unnamed protein product, partial [marine sediment metagenome]